MELLNTMSWNLPCIWPMVNALSKVSLVDKISNLVSFVCSKLQFKNFCDNPENHVSQYGAIAWRLAFQTNFPFCTDVSKSGTLIRADSSFRSIRDCKCHWMAWAYVAKDFGRLLRNIAICNNDCTAVSSTISTTTSAIILKVV